MVSWLLQSSTTSAEPFPDSIKASAVKVHMAINPSQRCHRAVIPNEQLSNAIEQEKSAKLQREEKEVKVET